ncbi:hypothetical protein FB382_000835 [Nocardioides ginsengisegetis]|uniref:CHRD domain-containing protein n=1 Tax=Nocardioides ginsengisegetis TaxID=661491 RepID=A0A7W3P8L5_9ACTN|nr:CHRD domain-containing protein [Nocardioides ginsengisegetis]MBA8802544.1 hypothetical protein [Nocardioides ginsengisegetis]
MTTKSLTTPSLAVAFTTALLLAGSGAAVTSSAADPAPARLVTVKTLEAQLGPGGDPDGSGEAHFRLIQATTRVCANVEWSNIGTPDAAHIHKVKDGSIVVDLTGSVTGGKHCAHASKALITRLLDHPRRYYFNVHNATYPAGAIRGPLHH